MFALGPLNGRLDFSTRQAVQVVRPSENEDVEALFKMLDKKCN